MYVVHVGSRLVFLRLARCTATVDAAALACTRYRLSAQCDAAYQGRLSIVRGVAIAVYFSCSIVMVVVFDDANEIVAPDVARRARRRRLPWCPVAGCARRYRLSTASAAAAPREMGRRADGRVGAPRRARGRRPPGLQVRAQRRVAQAALAPSRHRPIPGRSRHCCPRSRPTFPRTPTAVARSRSR